MIRGRGRVLTLKFRVRRNPKRWRPKVNLRHYRKSLVDPSPYSIEVFNTLGETIAVTSANASDLEPLLADEIFSVRKLSMAV